MDLNFTPEEEAFRQEVRDFFKENLPDDIRDAVRQGGELTKETMERYHAILNKKGWLATTWPKEYGGPGWGPVERHIFDEESCAAYAPRIVPFGLSMLGPVLQKFGSQEQKDYYLPRILNGDDWWCQGYSEPGAGSDLASLKTRAVRDGDEWVINGQKTWTTLGQHADWIFLLARTSKEEKKQLGISFICCEMDRPGVTLKPIITIDGKHVLNMVIFEDVRVPADYLIGEGGKGWTYSQYLLGFERTSYARIGGKRKQLSHIRALATAEPTGGNRKLIDDEAFARKLTAADMAVDGLEMTVLRVLSAVKDGGSPGKEASIIKILATETAQQITTLYLDVAAAHGQRKFEDSVSPDWLDHSMDAAPGVSTYFGARAQSIYGGTNEIQKNIIAKRVLGL